MTIHTIISSGIYVCFRKNKLWAVAAALMFYTQVPYRIMAANYNSLFAVFLLLFTITLLMLCEKRKPLLHIFAGIWYGCACVCNPVACLFFVVYAIVCILWNVKQKNDIKANNIKKKKVKLSQKQEVLNEFFKPASILKFCFGIAVIASISIVFFYATGGTIKGLIQNIPNLLSDEKHIFLNSANTSFANKLKLAYTYFSDISFNLPFLLPLFFLILLFDKKRTKYNHCVVYILISFIFVIFYTCGVCVGSLDSFRKFALSLPFFIFASVCYILTTNKNLKLFYCMYLPGIIATIIYFLTSNTYLLVFWVLTISNIAGVFFIKDFATEIADNKRIITLKMRNTYKICTSILCVSICLQLIFQCSLYMVGKVITPENIQINQGPLAGLMAKQQDFDCYNTVINDLNIIKQRNDCNEPIMIVSEFCWMYLHTDSPIASYSAWQPTLDIDRLSTYYKMNPDKIPKYIYIGWIGIPNGELEAYSENVEHANSDVQDLKEMFDCDIEALSGGYLLTVK